MHGQRAGDCNCTGRGLRISVNTDYCCEVPIPIIDTSIYLAVTRVTWHLKQLPLEEEKKKKKRKKLQKERKLQKKRNYGPLFRGIPRLRGNSFADSL